MTSDELHGESIDRVLVRDARCGPANGLDAGSRDDVTERCSLAATQLRTKGKTRMKWYVVAGAFLMGAWLAGATVVAQVEDPFAAPGRAPGASNEQAAGATTPASDEAGFAAPPAAAAAINPACAEVSEAMCTRADNTFLATCAGYVLAAVLLCVAWAAYWTTRGTTSMVAKVVLPMLAACALAGLGVGYDPFVSENYLCCVADTTFRAALLFGESRAARALAFGVGPAFVLYFVVLGSVQAFRRRSA